MNLHEGVSQEMEEKTVLSLLPITLTLSGRDAPCRGDAKEVWRMKKFGRRPKCLLPNFPFDASTQILQIKVIEDQSSILSTAIPPLN